MQLVITYLGEQLINSIILNSVTENEIIALMNDQSLKKATGSDRLPVKIWNLSGYFKSCNY